jgi:signal transduction histidine kinase
VARDTGAAEAEEFMSVAVHDLRNPIAVVRASAQMAQRQIRRGDADGAYSRLRSVVEQTDRLSEMLETFLDASRIQAGRLVLRTERVDLREIVDLAFDQASALTSEPTTRPLDARVPDSLVGIWDRARVIRAVRALLSNALYFGERTSPVLAEATRSEKHVLLLVSGRGRGPDGEEAKHLFERFYRGRTAAESGQSGSGLGLYTARGIARAHGGDVRYVGGDRFEMELPLSD